jgi:hypothetical protein
VHVDLGGWWSRDSSAVIRAPGAGGLLLAFDHVILGAPDLDLGLAFVAERLGVRAEAGGRHPRWGTRNALISLGEREYLEILAPDPAVSAPPEPRPFGIEGLASPRLVTWIARGTRLEEHVARARTFGIELGAVTSGIRERGDGVTLSWRMTDLEAPRESGVFPFLIDWGGTPHPAASAPSGCRLVAFAVEHPDAARLRSVFSAMGLAVDAVEAPAPALAATIRSPRGTVEIR